MRIHTDMYTCIHIYIYTYIDIIRRYTYAFSSSKNFMRESGERYMYINE